MWFAPADGRHHSTSGAGSAAVTLCLCYCALCFDIPAPALNDAFVSHDKLPIPLYDSFDDAFSFDARRLPGSVGCSCGLSSSGPSSSGPSSSGPSSSGPSSGPCSCEDPVVSTSTAIQTEPVTTVAPRTPICTTPNAPQFGRFVPLGSEGRIPTRWRLICDDPGDTGANVPTYYARSGSLIKTCVSDPATGHGVLQGGDAICAEGGCNGTAHAPGTNNCGDSMDEEEQCSSVCDDSSDPAGNFTCLFNGFVGRSRCGQGPDTRLMPGLVGFLTIRLRPLGVADIPPMLVGTDINTFRDDLLSCFAQALSILQADFAVFQTSVTRDPLADFSIVTAAPGSSSRRLHAMHEAVEVARRQQLRQSFVNGSASRFLASSGAPGEFAAKARLLQASGLSDLSRLQVATLDYELAIASNERHAGEELQHDISMLTHSTSEPRRRFADFLAMLDYDLYSIEMTIPPAAFDLTIDVTPAAELAKDEEDATLIAGIIIPCAIVFICGVSACIYCSRSRKMWSSGDRQ